MVNLSLEYMISEIRSFNAYVRSSVLFMLFLMLASGFSLGQSQADLELRLEREAKYEAWTVIQRYGNTHSLNLGGGTYFPAKVRAKNFALSMPCKCYLPSLIFNGGGALISVFLDSNSRLSFHHFLSSFPILLIFLLIVPTYS